MEQESARKIIKRLAEEDQRDRSSLTFRKYSDKNRLNLIGKRDAERIENLTRILKKGPELKGIDYFRAGLIFQHGQTKDSIKTAKEFAGKSLEHGYEPGRWLYAAATDRLLMMQGKKQRFGTQFRKRGNIWELHPIQEKTTDKERAEYAVLPLWKIKKVLSSLNREAQRPGVKKARVGLTRQK